AGCRLALILLSLVLLPLPLSAQRRWPGTTARRRVPPPGQLSLPERTLVVYNMLAPESRELADYYLRSRGIPAQNTCAITAPDTNIVAWKDYDAVIKTPLKSCLNKLGRDRILYIVLTWQTPWKLSDAPSEAGFEIRSIDSFIADIWNEQYQDAPELQSHPYDVSAQSHGNVYTPFVSLADYRAQPGARLIYSVWRLDAPTYALARGLVDKALEAETRGLRGNACYDRAYAGEPFQADWGYVAGDWDLRQAAAMSRLAGLPVIEDDTAAEFGAAPAPLRCDNAALYAGWYSYNNYNDAFSWVPGAIGVHLDSASALDPRGGANWAANALRRGITITSGAINEPYLGGLPQMDGVVRNLLEGANAGDAFLRNTAFLQWMNLHFGDPLYRPFPGGLAPYNVSAPAQASISFAPQFMVGGNAINGTIRLATPAPADGLRINLGSTHPGTATAPASVFVPAGQTETTFQLTTTEVTASQAAIVDATWPGGALANTVGVVPVLASLFVHPRVIKSGTTVKGTIYLYEEAPVGGALVTLTSDRPDALEAPAPVLIPAAQYKAQFTITAKPVSGLVGVTLAGTYRGAVERVTLTLAP
ncbi:MAG: TIGR03790 family protein, partial [Blastocatellia bacterium]